MTGWSLPRAPQKAERYDLGDGLQITLAPLAPHVRLACEARVAGLMASLRDGSRALEDLGFDGGDFGLLSDAHRLMGLGRFVAVQAFTLAAVRGWTVTDETGAPVEPSETSVRAVLSSATSLGPVHRQLEAIFEGDRSARLDEGNVSAPPPNGSGAAEPSTAEGVAPLRAKTGPAEAVRST